MSGRSPPNDTHKLYSRRTSTPADARLCSISTAKSGVNSAL